MNRRRGRIAAGLILSLPLAPCVARAETGLSTASASVTILAPSPRPVVLGSVAMLGGSQTAVDLSRDGESLLIVVQAVRTAAGVRPPSGLELVGPPGAVYAVSQSLNVFGADAGREGVIPLDARDSASRIVSPSGTDVIALGGRIRWMRQASPSPAALEITINYN